MKIWELLKTRDFDVWYLDQTLRKRRQVDARLERIEREGYFGDVHEYDGLTSLRWGDGTRVYTKKVPPNLLILTGGNKNGQSKDIARAKKLLRRIEEARSE